MNEKELAKDLLVIGYGIVIYAVIVSLFHEASELISVPECKIYHQNANHCEVYKEPGQSVIQ